MHDEAAKIRDAIIQATVAQYDLKEVGITQLVAERLKRQKRGLFQNEVDYRILMPHFRPPADGTRDASRFRADLAAFTHGGLILTEFKIADERRRTMNPWGVLHWLCRDMRKLETAAHQNRGRLRGVVQFVVAVRNSSHERNPGQVRLMMEHWGGAASNSRLPSVWNADYFSVLEVFRRYVQSEGTRGWKTAAERRGQTAFLSGVLRI